MNFTALVDVAIGLSVIFMGTALLVTIVNEYISQLFRLRASELTRNLATLLNAPELKTLVEKNAAFKPLLDMTNQVRTYVDPIILAQVMVGSLRETAAQTGTAPVASMAELVGAIDKLPASSIKSALWTLAQSATSVDKFVKGVSIWVDRSLIVLGEGYKQRMRLITLLLGFAIAIAFNVDTLNMAQRLYGDKELRDQLSVAAEQYVQKVSPEVFDRCNKLTPEDRKKAAECEPIQRMAASITQRGATFAKLPIGWDTADWATTDGTIWGLRFLGWIMTALAISLGAPFWFDALNRVVNVRHGISRPSPQKDDE
jgi:hypothetical protein